MMTNQHYQFNYILLYLLYYISFLLNYEQTEKDGSFLPVVSRSQVETKGGNPDYIR